MTVSARGGEFLKVTIPLTFLASLAVALRLLARWKSTMAFGADDYFIVAGLTFMFGMAANMIYSDVVGGLGGHEDSMSSFQIAVALKSHFASELLFFWAITATKISILLLYRRVFDVVRPFILATNVVGSICVLWCIAGTLVTIFQCWPISAAWSPPSLQPSRCINSLAFFLATGMSNVITDVIILCLIVRFVWKIQLPRRQKATSSGIFLLGGFVIVVAILRIVAYSQIDEQDVPYTYVKAAIWSLAEPQIAITCACLPALRLLSVKKAVMKRISGSFIRRRVSSRSTKLDTNTPVKQGPLDRIRTDAQMNKHNNYQELDDGDTELESHGATGNEEVGISLDECFMGRFPLEHAGSVV